MKRPSLAVLLGGGFLVAFGFVVWGLVAAWSGAGDAQISVHGWIAIAIAFGFTGLLGGGLMWLAFYSAKRGWDDLDRDA